MRVISGSLITSLEMAGVSLTLLKLTSDLLAYLGESCSALENLPNSGKLSREEIVRFWQFLQRECIACSSI